MSLPQIELDDRDFQSLVDEARSRIAHTCPAWDEHNVSDPGITLIELFAWMTDLLIYRVNRIPERVKIALLELIGVKLAPARVARTELRFRLSSPATTRVQLARGAGEVGTAQAPHDGPVVFRTTEPIVVPALRLEALTLVQRGTASSVFVQSGVARPSAAEQPGLWSPAEADDGIYLGFHDPLAALVVSVSADAAPALGPGIAPESPPWIWEVTDGEGGWSAASVLSDSTGGLNYASGTVELQLPRAEGPATVGGRRLHWLRCRLLEEHTAAGSGYTRAPRIEQLHAEAIGVLVAAEHAARAAAPRTLEEAAAAEATGGEIVGYSDGSPGQVFGVRHHPVLELSADEGLETLDPSSKQWVAWTLRDSLAESGPDDRHYCFDPIAGEVSFGLAIRERDGWVQRGKIPEDGVAVRMRYRWGGGSSGNVDANTLTVLRRPLPRIASVTNPERAHGGLDPESLDEALRRAPVELRTRSRAVTIEDYAVLAGEASRHVARASCVASGPGEAIVGILPSVAEPTGRISHQELDPPEDLLEEVALHLDERRLLGTSLRVQPIALQGVSVVTEVQAQASADPQQVERGVAEALYRFINPYVGGALTGESEGWELGRALTVDEVRLVIREVAGVQEVLFVRLYRTDLETGTPEQRPAERRVELSPGELIASAEHLVRAIGARAP